MSTDLSNHVEWLKREVAVPGTFESTYKETSDDLLAAALVDGLYAAKLEGWFAGYDADPDTFLTTPDLSMTGVGLVVVYAGIRFIQNELKNRPSSTTYEAPGGIKAETTYAASVSVERLKELQGVKDRLLELVTLGQTRTVVYTQDGYALRASSLYSAEQNYWYANRAANEVWALR